MPIELRDLTAEERIALVALVELIAENDGGVSDAEADRVDAIVAALGEDAYRAAAEEVDRRFGDEEDLRAFLPQVTRQDARELIYGTLLGEAMADVVNTREGELLDWLASQWNISTQIDDSGLEE